MRFAMVDTVVPPLHEQKAGNATPPSGKVTFPSRGCRHREGGAEVGKQTQCRSTGSVARIEKAMPPSQDLSSVLRGQLNSASAAQDRRRLELADMPRITTKSFDFERGHRLADPDGRQGSCRCLTRFVAFATSGHQVARCKCGSRPLTPRCERHRGPRDGTDDGSLRGPCQHECRPKAAEAV
jgi:hypothetical protein